MTLTLFPVHHREPRDRRTEVRDAASPERTDVDGLQVAASERDTCHPGRDSPAGAKQDVFGYLIEEERLLQGVDARRVAFVEQDAQIALGRQHEQLVGIHQRSPKVSVAVERDAVWPRALSQGARTEDLTFGNVAMLVDSQPCDAAASGLRDVEEFFIRVEADFVGKAKPVGDYAKRPALVSREVAVGQVGAKRVHPVLDSGRYRHPDSVFGVAEDEVDLSHGLAVDRGGENPRDPVFGHPLEAVGTEIGDQERAVAAEDEAVWQRPLQVTDPFISIVPKAR